MSRIGLGLLLIAFTFTSVAELTAQRRGATQSRTRAARTVPKTAIPRGWIDEVNFRSVGPTNMGGRITSLAVYEKDKSIWWAASASGGLLKTDNNGVTFEHQFTNESTVSIGDVQVAQSDPNIVWVGTGEANPRNSVSWGDGVYKSTDGGKTWKNMGLKTTFQIGRMAIHPKNPDIVYVGALGRLWGPNEERGLFKTTDGGKTWKKIHYINDKTGVIDVQMNPKNPNELIVATYERQRDGFDGNDPMKKYGDGSGIYKTTDGGKTFTKLTKGLPTNKLGRIGLDYFRKDPRYIYAIVECEKIAQIPENYAYAGLNVADIEGGVGAKVTTVTGRSPAERAGLKEDDIVLEVNGKILHKSADMMSQIRRSEAGKTLKLKVVRDEKTMDVNLKLGKRAGQSRGNNSGARGGRRTGGRNPFTGTLGGQSANRQHEQTSEGHEYGGIYMSKNGGKSWTRINSLNPRPMYYSQFRVDPVDRNFMYVCGTSLYKSKDGGETFTGDGGSDGIHVDHHALWIDPSNPKHMILGNDGGIHVTYDRMTHWHHHNNVAICQFYHISVDTRPDYRIYGGLQDNGSWGGPSVVRNGNGPTNTDWYRVGGGDGFITFADPNDPDQIYFESQNGGMGRNHLKTGARGFIRPQRTQGGPRYRFNWKTPFILSPHNSEIHYSAGNYVFRSVKKGDALKRISPDITNTSRGSGSAISESPVTEGVIYVGTTDGAVWMTRDGGEEWKPIFSTKEDEKKEEAKEENNDETIISTNDQDAPLGIEISTAIPAADDSGINGKWDGEFISEQIPSGRAAFTLNLKSGRAGSLSGDYKSRRGQGKITKGQFDQKSGAIRFLIENERVSLLFSGKVKDGKMSGDININDGQLKIDFLAKRAKSAVKGRVKDGFKDQGKAGDNPKAPAKKEKKAPSKDKPALNPPKKPEAKKPRTPKKPAPKKPEAKKAEPKKEPAVKVEKKPAAVVVSDDLVSGTWDGVLLSDQIPEGSNGISMTLKMDKAGKVTGSYETAQGGGAISGKYDPKTKKVTFSAENQQFTIEFNANVTKDKMEGSLDINDGAFSIDFEAKRTSKPKKSEAKADQEEGKEEKSDEPLKKDSADNDDDDEKKESDNGSAKPLSELVPGPRWVSSIEASRYRAGRVYLSLDGHRSNDDEVYVFASENYGRTWKSIRANIPTSAGSVRCVREDIENSNVLYLGCEFSAWVSIDRGLSWTQFAGGFPTVSTHEIAQHKASGDLIMGTHGRAVWIGNAGLIRQLTPEALEADAHLFKPNKLVRWRREAARGNSGTHQFNGGNSSTSSPIYYSLGEDAEEVKLVMTDLQGNTIREFETKKEKGLHKINFDGRRQGRLVTTGRFAGRRFGGAPLAAGSYLLTLSVDGESKKQIVIIENDPAQPEATATQLMNDYMEEVFNMEKGEEEGDNQESEKEITDF